MKTFSIFYISGKMLEMKEIIIPISVTAIFVFSWIAAIKIDVFVEIFCSCRAKYEDLG